MGLTDISGATTYVHPTFLYESLWNALGLLLLHFFSKKRKYDGQVFVAYLGWYGLGRLFIEGLRADSLYFFGTNLRVSQLVAGLCVIFAVVYLFYNKVFREHDPEALYVNRVAAAEAAAAVAVETAQEAATEETPEVQYGENKDAPPIVMQEVPAENLAPKQEPEPAAEEPVAEPGPEAEENNE